MAAPRAAYAKSQVNDGGSIRRLIPHREKYSHRMLRISMTIS
jgi:hypothetical protein